MAAVRAGESGEHVRRLPARPDRVRQLARGARPDLANGDRRGPVRAHRRTTDAGECAVDDRSPARRDPLAASLPRQRGPPRRRPDDRRRGRPHPRRDPQGTLREPGQRAAGGRDGRRSDRPPRSGPARAALRHGRADLRGVRPVDGRHRLRRAARPVVRQGCQGAHRPVRAGGGRRPRPLVRPGWSSRSRSGAVAATRRRQRRVPQHPRRAADPAGGVGGRQEVRPSRRSRFAPPVVAARPAPQLRNPPARSRRRPARRPGVARPRLDLDDAGVHQGQPGALVAGVPRRPTRVP